MSAAFLRASGSQGPWRGGQTFDEFERVWNRLDHSSCALVLLFCRAGISLSGPNTRLLRFCITHICGDDYYFYHLYFIVNLYFSEFLVFRQRRYVPISFILSCSLSCPFPSMSIRPFPSLSISFSLSHWQTRCPNANSQCEWEGEKR